MGKTILISLVSDQTRPNIQLINKFKSTTDLFLFLTTKGMENKGCRRWIENAAHITEEVVDFMEICEFSFDDILSRLEGYGFSDTDTFIVNLTGGTKVMSIAVYEFFRHKNSKLIYITGGSDGKYIEIDGKTGERKERELNIKEEKLEDYLSGYGFSPSTHKLSGHGLSQATNIFDLYCDSSQYSSHEEAIQAIHLKRGKTISGDEYLQVENFLEAVKFSPTKPGELSKSDTKYLSGDWFEEFIGISIQNELHLSDEQLYIGTQICKDTSIRNINDFGTLKIHPNPSSKQNENEIDVMFLHNGRFYTIECKSSILSKGRDGGRPRSILSETIYKCDSLKSRFGLFADTSIVTLTNFEEEYKSNRKQNIINDVNRANLSNIRLVDRNMLLENRNRISEIFVKQ